ncbi:MAG: FeoB-associated Cys-rich membrane protein [Desulfovibrio sp.]
MSEFMDNALVALIVGGALIYMGRRYWRKFSGKDSCGCSGCGGCSSAPKDTTLTEFSPGKASEKVSGNHDCSCSGNCGK